MLIVSPHFDDAALSAWKLLGPGSRVAVVFAGMPRPWKITPHDRRMGIWSSAWAVSQRRREHAHAMSWAKTETVLLPFLDGQYGKPADRDAIREEIRRLGRGRRIVIPAVQGDPGHTDHALVHEACADLAHAEYDDLPYLARGGKPGPMTLTGNDFFNKQNSLFFYRQSLEAFSGAGTLTRDLLSRERVTPTA